VIEWDQWTPQPPWSRPLPKKKGSIDEDFRHIIDETIAMKIGVQRNLSKHSFLHYKTKES
jgi:hypothetical protein